MPEMRAVAVERFGEPPKLMALPKPVPGPGELLVKIAGAGVNPFDLTVASGWVADRAKHVFPLVLGVEGAGVVTGRGAGSSRFELGDHVYGVFLTPPYGRGTYAEYAVVPERSLIAAAPSGIELARAGAAPACGITALGLLELTQVRDGQTALIVGASGGVGSFAIQLAASRGARVIATAKPDSEKRLEELGASATIDYATTTPAEQPSPIAHGSIDVLIDLVSDAEQLAANLELLTRGGSVASTRYVAVTAASIAQRTDVHARDYAPEHATKPLLARLTSELEAGVVGIDVQREITLPKLPEAICVAHSRGARGKTLVTV